jgi:hypothetical protein
MMTYMGIRKVLERLGLCGCAIALLSGCAAPPRRPEISAAIATTQYRLAMSSARAPAGDDWVQFAQSNGRITIIFFLKKGDTPSHHYIADLGELRTGQKIETAEDVRKHVVGALRQQSLGRTGYRIVEEDIVPCERWGTKGFKCDLTIHDYKAPGRGDRKYLTTHTIGYALQHPDEPGLFVVMAYHERGHAEELDAAATEAAAEAFFASLQLHSTTPIR